MLVWIVGQSLAIWFLAQCASVRVSLFAIHGIVCAGDKIDGAHEIDPGPDIVGPQGDSSRNYGSCLA